MKRGRDSFMDTAKRSKYQSGGVSRSELNSLVKKALKGEKTKKGADYSHTVGALPATLTSNASIEMVNTLVLGDNGYHRSGPEVEMESLRLRGILSFHSKQELVTGDWDTCIARLMVVQIKDPSNLSAIPNFDAMFGWTGTNGTSGVAYDSGVKYDEQGNIRILRDVIVTPEQSQFMSHTGLANHQQRIHVPFDIFVPLKGMKTEWDQGNTTGAIGGCKKNALLVVMRSNSNVTHAYVNLAVGTSRLRWRE
jgi:hypothetical protein